MENMSLVRERVTNLQTIKEINAAYTLEQGKYQTLNTNYEELLEAKEIDTEKWNANVKKMIDFKNSVKIQLDKNKSDMEKSNGEKEHLWKKLKENTQQMEQMQEKAAEAIETAANSKFAQLQSDAAKELRTLRDEKKSLTS